MPNEVYRRTRDGLAALVSPRVADTVLAGALREGGISPADIDSVQMRSLLLGPIMGELQNVLPSRGLKRNLHVLARKLVGLDGSAPAADTGTIWQTTFGGGVRADGPLGGGSAGVPTRSPSPASAELAEQPEQSPPANTEPVARPRRTAAGLAGPAPRRKLTPLGPHEWEERLTHFAQLEQVRLVAAVGVDGSVISSRGEGLDVETLARLGSVAIGLLSRSGTVRSLHLSHTSGELFLYPVAGQLLVLLGGRALNIGAVATTFASLFLEEVV